MGSLVIDEVIGRTLLSKSIEVLKVTGGRHAWGRVLRDCNEPRSYQISVRWCRAGATLILARKSILEWPVRWCRPSF